MLCFVVFVEFEECPCENWECLGGGFDLVGFHLREEVEDYVIPAGMGKEYEESYEGVECRRETGFE